MKCEEVILRLSSKQLTFCAAGCPSLPPASSTKWGSSTETVLRALRAVVEQRGIFCSLYSDRASHFWLTPKAGELRQSGTSTAGAGHRHDSGVFAQARGRSERNVGTWQRRLPQELRLRGISTREEANRFLRENYVAEFNRKFAVAAAARERVFAARRAGSGADFRAAARARGQPR
jgi:hypothetical protein